MSLSENLKKIIEESLPKDLYLVDLVVSESKIRNKISIFIDSDEGIGIDQCGTISRALGEIFDEKIELAYTLEVSSPGADSSIKLPRQYLKNIGRTLKITQLEGEIIKGELLAINNEILDIKPEAKKKEKLENIQVNLNQIKDAKVVISFK